MGLASRAARPERPRRSGAPRIVFLRPVGSGTVIHRLWAATKLLAVAAVSITLSFRPSWPTLGLLGVMVAGAVLAARVPWGARPRLGWWFWVAFAVGAFLTLFAGGKPEVQIGNAHIGFGALDQFARFTVFSLVLFTASLLVGWTTPAAELAPALARLGRPLRVLRLPVEEWAVTVALSIRCLPMLVQELRTLVAARRLRPAPRGPKGRRWHRLLDEPVDLMAASLAVAMRRAAEIGEAISARGGTGAVAAGESRPHGRDAAALVIVAVVCAAGWIVPAS